jgi:pSer/pThr/pTyr-binding forkhead associated (FHA) protein
MAPNPLVAGASRQCPSCGGQTPGNFTFCQHCGSRLPAAPAPTPTPPAGPAMPVTIQPRAPEPPRAPDPVRAPEAVAATLAASDLRTPAEFLPRPKTPTQPAPQPPPEPVFARGLPLCRMTSVRRDGSDGEAYDLTGEQADLGRSGGDIRIPEDRFLAPRHARILRQGDRYLLRPLDTTNGVYLRLRGEPVELVSGDLLLLGKEVLRFELLGETERATLPAVDGGVNVFGSPVRPTWARLRQLLVTGVGRDVIHICADMDAGEEVEFVLGREDGDLRFPDDEFMSRRHAVIRRGPAGNAKLSDVGSSNGTYIRLRDGQDHELRPGDLVRMGDQLFRFEPPKADPRLS